MRVRYPKRPICWVHTGADRALADTDERHLFASACDPDQAIREIVEAKRAALLALEVPNFECTFYVSIVFADQSVREATITVRTSLDVHASGQWV